MEQKNKIEQIKEIIKESTYLFYEMKDVKKEIFLNNTTNSIEENKYTKYISPLFDSDVIDADFNRDLLDIIFEEAPFYYKEPAGELLADTTILSSTRDVGINDVASPLQTEFWSVLFREALGSVQNDLLLSIYNKLRYPFIGEQQYLNANLFPELAKKYFDKREGAEGDQIEFKNTAADNLQDIYEKQEADKKKNGGILPKKKYLGCTDYLDDIVNQKLSSIYAILDYHPDSSNLLNIWAESMLNSGRLQVENIEREKTIYKLQDIRYELLKRKFAGSSTLYSLALSSINRRGSLLKTVTVGDTYLDSSTQYFKDSRPLRILDMPGLLTEKHVVTSVSPYDIFYTKAKEKNQEIPLGILTPLYYTSGSQGKDGLKGGEMYSAENFFQGPGNEEYQTKFLRGNSGIINWNKPSSPIYPDSFSYTYTILDAFKIHKDSASGKRIYRELDMPLYIEMPGRDPIKKEMNTLDIKIPTISSSAISGVVLDISLDTILYHRNTIQRTAGSDYDYVTYPLSDNASLSLMDVEWMNFIKGNTEEKSRVQDNLSFGSQVSFYKKLDEIQTVSHAFYAISYGDDTVDPFDPSKVRLADNPRELFDNAYSFDEWVNIKGTYPKYAYLWYCPFEYTVNSFTAHNFNPILISKITLKVGVENEALSPYNWQFLKDNIKNPIRDLYKDIDDAYVDYREHIVNLYNTHLGIIPFTYKDIKDGSLLSLKLGIYEDENNIVSYYDDLADLNYNKAIFAFSDYDLLTLESMREPAVIGDLNDSSKDPFSRNTLYFINGFTEFPTENTKTVFYGIRELAGKNKDGDNIYRYRWSAPINVINLHNGQTSFSKFTYKPDWMGLQFYLNPYLNFTPKSASPLRNKKVLKINSNYISNISKFDEDAALCNLVKMRGLNYLSNDTGKGPEDYSKLPNTIGTYLYHNHSTDIAAGVTDLYPRLEYVDIFGDNRSPDYFDAAFNAVIGRGKTYIDPNSISKKQCIGFNFPPINARTDNAVVYSNYFQLLPIHPDYISTDSTKASKLWYAWAWNNKRFGFTVCCNIEIIPEYFEKVLNIKSKNPEISNKLSTALTSEWTIINRNREFTLSVVDIKNTYENTSNEISDKKNISFRFRLNITSPSISADDSALLSDATNDIVTSLYSQEYKISEDIHSSFYRIAFEVSPGEDSTGDFTEDNIKVLFIINDKIQKFDKENIEYDNINKLPGSIKNILIPKKYGIELGTLLTESGEQKDVFFGNIYDLRLYNRPSSLENLLLMSRGTTYELYSYAPSVYKLGYNIYKDLGIFKFSNIFEIGTGLPRITELRAFNRSVWDSILVDMYPTSLRETNPEDPCYKEDAMDPKDDSDIFIAESDGTPALEDAVQQTLLDTVEVSNNTRRFAGESADLNPNEENIAAPPIDIRYNGKEISIGQQDTVTAITTMVQPTIYDRADYISKSILSYKIKDDKIILNTIESAPINLPISAEKGTLQYEAGLNVNFMVDSGIDLSMRFTSGKNIQTLKNSKLGKHCVGLKKDNRDRGPVVNSSQNNFILAPFTLPDQTNILKGKFVTGRVNKLNLKGVQLNLSLNDFLTAINYYTEIRVPEPVGIRNEVPTGCLSKWHAIRTLREGSYYFTYKYPVQILPFSERDMKSSDSSFATYYATARFKVEVRGIPVKYDSKKYALKNITRKYKKAIFKETFNSDVCLENNNDNRTFPHRLINIDLYVMDTSDKLVINKNEPIEPLRNNYKTEEDYQEAFKKWQVSHNNWEKNYYPIWQAKTEIIKNLASGYSWKLIGSNHNFSNSSVIELNKVNLQENLCISEEIPFFLGGSYNGPFFTSYMENGVPHPKELKDDNINRPINLDLDNGNQKADEGLFINTINSSYSKDKLYVNDKTDIKNIRLTAGRSYRLLFDYEAIPVEISYSKYVENNPSYEYPISFNEYFEYPKSYSLLQPEGDSSAYKYNAGTDLNFVNKILNDKSPYSVLLNKVTAGYETIGYPEGYEDKEVRITITDESGKEIPADESVISTGWKSGDKLSDIENSVGLSVLRLGNPYSKNKDENILLNGIDVSPADVYNMYTFQYMPTEIPAGVTKTLGYDLPDNSILVVDENGQISELENFDEFEVIKKASQRRKEEISNAILNLKKSVSGIFSQISEIYPSISFFETTSLKPFNSLKYSYITSSDYDLYSYNTVDTSIKINSGISIGRYSLYRNNLIPSQDFSKKNLWYFFGDADRRYVTEPAVNIKNSGSAAYEVDFFGDDFIKEIEFSTEIFTVPKKNLYEIAVALEVEKNGKILKKENGIEPVDVIAIFENDGESYRVPLKRDILIAADTSKYNPTVWTAQTDKEVNIKTLKIQVIETGKPGAIRPDKLLIYDVILRSGQFNTHTLGLADNINNKDLKNNTSPRLQIGSYPVVAYKKHTDKDICNYIPVVFKGTEITNDVSAIESGKVINTVTPSYPSSFITKNALPLSEKGKGRGFFTEGLTKLHQPWIRTLVFTEGKQTGVDKKGNAIYDENKVEILQEELVGNTFKRIPGDDREVFSKINIEYDNSVGSENLKLTDLCLNTIPIDSRVTSGKEFILDSFNTNLRVNTDPFSDLTPATLINEKISGLTNCFHGENFALENYTAKSSLVELTNIQLLTPEDPNEENTRKTKIFGEIEYLPIIYDEANHHISLNIMLHRKVGGTDSK